MPFSPFRAFYGWFGRDQMFGFPHSAQQPDITDTRLDATSTVADEAPLTIATQGPRPRLPDMYARRCKITLAANAVGGHHTAFRMLVTHKNLPNEVLDSADANRPASDGADIHFSIDEGGAYELPCQIVTYTQDATPANARVEIWVLVPHVNNTADTNIYMWWKGPAEFDQWVATYLFKPSEVWEFYRDYLTGCHGLEGVTPPRSITRAPALTGDFNYLTASGLAAAAGVWEGNGAIDFATGSIRYLYAPTTHFVNSESPSNSGFISMWFKKATASFAANAFLFSFGDGLAADPAKKCYACIRSSDQKVEFVAYTSAGVAASQTILSTNAVSDTDWHHLVCAWNGNDIDGVMEMYLDGALQSQLSRTYGVTFPASLYLVIGSPDLASTTLHWYGQLDEIRYGTFVLPQGFAATEHVCGKFYDQVVTFEAPVTPAAAVRPYAIGDRQYIMVGPKLNEPRSVRYEHRFLPLVDYVLGEYDTVQPSTVNSSEVTGWFFAKRIPPATQKTFRIYRTRRVDEYAAESYSAAPVIYNGRDPAHAMQRLPKRGAGAYGYSVHMYFDYGEPYYGILPISQVISQPEYFSFKLPVLSPSSLDQLYCQTFEIAFPAASSAGAPNAIPVWDTYSYTPEYLDECYLNGNGADKEIYLAMTAIADSIDHFVRFMVPYGQSYTVREYGADSTFTTVLTTTLVTNILNITESGLTLGDVRYYKISPTNKNRETLVQVLATL